jgi:putative peptidoglycan lipid II flippase
MAPRVFGAAMVQLNFWVNTNLASRMAEGSVTAVTWAFTIMLRPQAVIAQSVATAALPTLSGQFALGRLDELRASLAASLRGILLLAIPASLGLILLRQPVTALLLQYGRFSAASTQLISWALLWFAAGLVGHCVVEIMARAFYSMHDTKTPVLVGVVAMGLNVVLSLLLSSYFSRIGWMPHGGLALANSIATGLEAASLWVLMRRRLGGLEGLRVLKGTGQAVLATLVMAGVVLGWLGLIGERQAWLVGGGGVLLGGMVYGLVVWGLKVPEVYSLINLLKRRLRPAYK